MFCRSMRYQITAATIIFCAFMVSQKGKGLYVCQIWLTAFVPFNTMWRRQCSMVLSIGSTEATEWSSGTTQLPPLLRSYTEFQTSSPAITNPIAVSTHFEVV